MLCALPIIRSRRILCVVVDEIGLLVFTSFRVGSTSGVKNGSGRRCRI